MLSPYLVCVILKAGVFLFAEGVKEYTFYSLLTGKPFMDNNRTLCLDSYGVTNTVDAMHFHHKQRSQAGKIARKCFHDT